MLVSTPAKPPLLPNTIKTERLVLRPFTENDIDDIMLYATDPRWSKYLPVPHPYERKHAIDFIDLQKSLDRSKKPHWAICLKGRVVGGINLRFDFTNQRAELGYSIAPSVWGQGLVTEAARALINLAFNTHPALIKITANADTQNLGSLRVLQKLGMQTEGILRKHLKVREKHVDVVVSGVLREDWK